MAVGSLWRYRSSTKLLYSCYTSLYYSMLPDPLGTLNKPAAAAHTDYVPEITEKRLLKAVVLGAPNAGKSTLVNQLVGQKIVAVSPKVHTTRQRTLGIFTVGSSQVILLDTPGVISYRHGRNLNVSKSFLTSPRMSTEEADMILLIIDASNKRTRLELSRDLINILAAYPDLPVALILNKVDLLKHKHVLFNVTTSLLRTPLCLKRDSDNIDLSQKEGKKSQPAAQEEDEDIEGKRHVEFSQVFMISALTGDGSDKLKDYLIDSAQVTERWEYSAEHCTDQTPETIATEIIREKLYNYFDKEIPYVVTQSTVVWDKLEDGTLRILKDLKCLKDGQVRIVIGPGGRTIQEITNKAAQELEMTFGCPVNLEIHVKLKKR